MPFLNLRQEDRRNNFQNEGLAAAGMLLMKDTTQKRSAVFQAERRNRQR